MQPVFFVYFGLPMAIGFQLGAQETEHNLRGGGCSRSAPCYACSAESDAECINVLVRH